MPRCILLVDDNLVIRRMLRTTFETAGWEVCGEAENGREAIDKAQKVKPDLIVLDLSMPVMNGLEAAPVLRHMMPAVPIILFTLHHDNSLDQQASSAGVTTVMSKEDSVNTLVDRANVLLGAA
jgi:CheY-like chemotaxis protein